MRTFNYWGPRIFIEY